MEVATEKKRVVFAKVCKNCESIVGGEKVVSLDAEDIQSRLEKDSDNFFRYHDVHHKAEYRSVSYAGRCVQC